MRTLTKLQVYLLANTVHELLKYWVAQSDCWLRITTGLISDPELLIAINYITSNITCMIASVCSVVCVCLSFCVSSLEKIFVRARLCAFRCMSYGIAGPCVLQEVVYVSAPVSTPIQRLFICLAASAGRSDQLRHAPVDKLRRAQGAAIEAVWLRTTFHCSPGDKDRWIHLLAVQIQDAEYCRQRCLYGAPLCIVDVFWIVL